MLSEYFTSIGNKIGKEIIGLHMKKETIQNGEKNNQGFIDAMNSK